MKVLLTGATGFVGSHLLEGLLTRQIPVRALVRPGAAGRVSFPAGDLLEIREGNLADPTVLGEAVRKVTHVLHCAGATKALTARAFYEANQILPRLLADACSTAPSEVRRLVLISSLAAHGPGTRAAPAREDDSPRPVSQYGHSKLAGETEVACRFRGGHVILRPGAMYGPRDREFLPLFRAVQRGWAPVMAGGRQELDLIYAPDLVAVVLETLEHPQAAGRVYHVAAGEVVTAAELVDTVAVIVGRQPRRVPIPALAVRWVCAASGLMARLTGRPSILAQDKYRELLAPGWVSDGSRLTRELGVAPRTPLREGLAATWAWYQRNGWE